MTATATYRWNTAPAATDYDNAAPEIHPCYTDVQDALVGSLPLDPDKPARIVDLGGGSGRLLERLLPLFPAARATLVDPSEAFLGLAARRLAPYTQRVSFVRCRAQDPWADRVGRADAIVSTSALHHLDGREKSDVFAACRAALAPGGVFLNGDEFRPPSDAAYRALLEDWAEHMESRLAIGTIPGSFRPIVQRWRERNLDGFGGPRQSGDDCHETIEEQAARLYGAGFAGVETVWRDRLWAVVRAAA